MEQNPGPKEEDGVLSTPANDDSGFQPGQNVWLDWGQTIRYNTLILIRQVDCRNFAVYFTFFYANQIIPVFL
jgi:hypothetical protein